MANVLPPDAQKKVWATYRARFILVTSLVLLALAGAAAVTMFPSYVAVQLAESRTSEEGTEAEEVRAQAIALERSQFLIKELMPLVSATSSAVDVVAATLDMKPSAVRISRIIYAQEPEEGRLTLIGAGSRGDVSAFKDALTNSGLFTAVSVPVGALVGSESGGFSIVLAGPF